MYRFIKKLLMFLTLKTTELFGLSGQRSRGRKSSLRSVEHDDHRRRKTSQIRIERNVRKVRKVERRCRKEFVDRKRFGGRNDSQRAGIGSNGGHRWNVGNRRHRRTSGKPLLSSQHIRTWHQPQTFLFRRFQTLRSMSIFVFWQITNLQTRNLTGIEYVDRIISDD